MGHGSVLRRTLHFGARNPGTGAFASSIPNRAAFGGRQSLAGDAAAITTAGIASHDSARVSQRIELAPRGFSAIAIAPDSVISCCDIALGGDAGEVMRHRISPGNPLVGCLDEIDFALVSIPISIPLKIDESSIVALDSVNIGLSEADLPFRGFPLRLELWRGSVFPMRVDRRAPWSGYAIVANMGGGAKQVYVCVDGRRRVDVIVAPDTDGPTTVTVSLFAIDAVASDVSGQDDPLEIPLELDSSGSTTLPATLAAPLVLSFDGNPMTGILVDVTNPVGGTTAGPVHVHVRAWD